VFPGNGLVRPETCQSWCFMILSLYNTDFALSVKRGDIVLILNNIPKYVCSFSLSRTVRLGNEPSRLLNFPVDVLYVIVYIPRTSKLIANLHLPQHLSSIWCCHLTFPPSSHSILCCHLATNSFFPCVLSQFLTCSSGGHCSLFAWI
jgi:hypothetical protein